MGAKEMNLNSRFSEDRRPDFFLKGLALEDSILRESSKGEKQSLHTGVIPGK